MISATCLFLLNSTSFPSLLRNSCVARINCRGDKFSQGTFCSHRNFLIASLTFCVRLILLNISCSYHIGANFSEVGTGEGFPSKNATIILFTLFNRSPKAFSSNSEFSFVVDVPFFFWRLASFITTGCVVGTVN